MPNPAPRYWIKLHRAILAIGCGVRPYAQPPQFVAAEFYESLQALSPTLVAKAREWRPGANDLEFALFFENAKFEIALGGGEFSFDTFDPAQGLAARAYCFAEEFSSLDFVGVDDEFRTEILNLSAAICDSATDEFNEALWYDEWKLMARLGTPLAKDFERIPYDVWNYLTVEDWELGTASAPTGERVFSIHVAPSEGLPEIDREVIPFGDMSQQRNRTRALPRRQSAFDAIARLWPGGIPSVSEKPNKQLVAEVEAWCDRNRRVKPSPDTILRAVGRR